MLFWIFFIVFVVGLVSIVLNKKSYSKNQDDTSKFWKLMYSDFMDVVPLYVTLISFIIVCVMTIFIGVQRISADSDEARHIECYKTLLYKAEMDDIRHELGLTNKEYVDEIQKWNMMLCGIKPMPITFGQVYSARIG